jgi:hypothetical protein
VKPFAHLHPQLPFATVPITEPPFAHLTEHGTISLQVVPVKPRWQLQPQFFFACDPVAKPWF